MKDFFISYTKADQSWAEWIAWQLENEGYETVIQAWDFHAGSNFVSEMQKSAIETDCTIAVISPAFFTSPYTEAEWTSAFANDPTGAKRKFVMVRVEDVELTGLLKPRVYIDLVGLNAKDASERLLKQIKGERAKPLIAPTFPGTFSIIDDSKPNFPGELPPIWNVPLRRNQDFTGRDTYLRKLASEFNSGKHSALTQVIIGLGGIGKTQIALEYAYRYSANYQAIWWIRSEDERTKAADYAAFATKVNLPEKDAAEEQVVINAVRNWLEHNRNWLFIFDNAVKPEDINDYLPRGASGHVLITSRHQAWKKLCPSLSIDIWPREESVDFLNRRTKDKNKASAGSVADELGDLPLALEQAAAFQNETGIGFDDYLRLYRTRRTELWDEESPPSGYPDTVGTTWSLAIEKVQEEVPAGVLVLNLCSYLAPDRIPLTVISEARKYLPENLSTLIRDSLALNKGIKALTQYSLIKAQPNNLDIHPLVQVSIRNQLSIAEQKLWSEVAVKSVNSVFPSGGYQRRKLWPECAALFPHGKAVIAYAAENNVALKPAADLLGNINSYLHVRVSFSDADKILRNEQVSNEKIEFYLKIFLCHASEDKGVVSELYKNFSEIGFKPWLDKEDIGAGMDWRREIEKAVRNSDVILVFLSCASTTKTGYVQKEIKKALDVADEQPEGTVFLIPIKIEECRVPDRLSHVQWVNLFEEDGYDKLLKALKLREKDIKDRNQRTQEMKAR